MREFLDSSFRPGDRVRVRHRFFDHVGTVADDGWIWANSARHGRVCKVPPSDFSGGKPILNDGPGPRHPRAALREIEAREGEPYSLLFNNCEHLVQSAHGLGHRSPQLRDAAKMAGLAVARFYLSSRGIRR